MEIIETVKGAKVFISEKRRSNKTIGFVPTLGFLHKGHQALMEKARQENDIVAVSIFVNPLQFKRKQFEEYPRDLERDKKIIDDMGVDMIFSPSVNEMYPSVDSIGELFKLQLIEPDLVCDDMFVVESNDENELDDFIIAPRDLTNKLDGKYFPWHFDAVATIVHRLFKTIEPDRAYFGEKDFQQLLILREMAKELWLDIEIKGVPTVRDSAGLALSSRNSLLTTDQRHAATIVYTALKKGEEMIKNGEKESETIISKISDVINSEPIVEIDFAGIVCANTLERVRTINGNVILYASYFINGIRLTDNIIVRLN